MEGRTSPCQLAFAKFVQTGRSNEPLACNLGEWFQENCWIHSRLFSVSNGETFWTSKSEEPLNVKMRVLTSTPASASSLPP
jgi:hypothetical protein